MTSQSRYSSSYRALFHVFANTSVFLRDSTWRDLFLFFSPAPKKEKHPELSLLSIHIPLTFSSLSPARLGNGEEDIRILRDDQRANCRTLSSLRSPLSVEQQVASGR